MHLQSTTFNRSSAIHPFKYSDAIEIRNGIIFDFYTGLSHICSHTCLIRNSLLCRIAHVYLHCRQNETGKPRVTTLGDSTQLYHYVSSLRKWIQYIKISSFVTWCTCSYLLLDSLGAMHWEGRGGGGAATTYCPSLTLQKCVKST